MMVGEGRKQELLFLKKKKQKNVRSLVPRPFHVRRPHLAKVFGFFFAKKKRLLALLTSPAR
jgi:hypothetical protein